MTDDRPSSPFLPAVLDALGEGRDAARLIRSSGDEVLPLLPSPLPVGRLAHDAVAAAALEAALLIGTDPAPVALDPQRVATAYTGEKHFLRDGVAPDWWADLSGFHPTADGWLRTHANYPHHRAALVRALRLPAESGRDDARAALRALPSLEAEQRIAEVGGVAAAVRTPDAWSATPQGAAAGAAPILATRRIGDADPRPLPSPGSLAGVRVLDLTRVIAGPVATQTLALLGADVLRIDPPALPEPVDQWLVTSMGKRSALLDLRTDREAFDRLLAQADVVVTGYRPGALDALGLAPGALAERRPGIVVARLSAWGGAGPWSSRRGFDSIVQAASGIAAVTAAADGTPGALPAQALDHSAGYLLAAAVLALLRRRSEVGGAYVAETSLAGIAAALLAAPRPDPAPPGSLAPTLVQRVTPSGRLTYAAPALPGHDDWPSAGQLWGGAAPVWRSADLEAPRS
ncbi:CoA transferase [Naasia sp. SYSU D00057]|uniref:CoA transferase n=1 Tax=Naasia sp. SYSU D00057 TaxID=2817380 RepID=UPI001B30859E|nr:CoA transferase [Naasia sp. SYSU D00057]